MLKYRHNRLSGTTMYQVTSTSTTAHQLQHQCTLCRSLHSLQLQKNGAKENPKCNCDTSGNEKWPVFKQNRIYRDQANPLKKKNILDGPTFKRNPKVGLKPEFYKCLSSSYPKAFVKSEPVMTNTHLRSRVNDLLDGTSLLSCSKKHRS